jgi:electron transport complex protein RnfE
MISQPFDTPKAWDIAVAGLIKENPTLKMILGCCPTLAVTTAVGNGLGMGLATTAVLMCSNMAISLLRGVIPEKVRIASYIIIIAGFVTVVMYVLKAWLPELDKALGIYIPLIVANCILLARAEMFAAKYKPFPSLLDGLFMGLGFTLALFTISTVREILGSGTWFGLVLTKNLWAPAVLMILPPGGFLAFGLVITGMNRLTNGKIAAPMCATCSPERCAP